MKVLVYGGTGSQGRAIVTRLKAQGHQPTIITRNLDNAADLAQQGVHVVLGDLNDRASLEAASLNMDAVVLTITFVIADQAQAFAYAKNAIDAANKTGVKLLVYNTSGPILDEPIGNAGYDVRPQIIAYLQSGNLPYIVLQPPTYLENLLGPWTRQGIIDNDTLAYPVSGEQPIGWLATADLAALVVAALERPELAPSHFIISGEENLSGHELADRFSQALGREIRYYSLPLETFAAALESLLGEGAGEGVLPGYRLLRDHPERVVNWVDMRPVLEKLPVRMTSIDEWLAQFAPLFAPQATLQPE